MVIHEMTEEECRAMLARRHVARLACARNNQPYIVPFHFDLDDECLYGFATLGQKIEWMRQNPLVCLEIDELTTKGQWESVVVFGQYEELPHAPQYEGAREVAQRLFQNHPMWWEPASIPLATHEPAASSARHPCNSAHPGRHVRGESAGVAGSGSAPCSGEAVNVAGGRARLTDSPQVRTMTTSSPDNVIATRPIAVNRRKRPRPMAIEIASFVSEFDRMPAAMAIAPTSAAIRRRRAR
jgi:uncharacterized protein